MFHPSAITVGTGILRANWCACDLIGCCDCAVTGAVTVLCSAWLVLAIRSDAVMQPQADAGANAETRFLLLQQSFDGMFELNATTGSVLLSAELCDAHATTQLASVIAQVR